MNTSSVPLYQQIADELRQNIEASVYPVGSQLPTEADLSDRFGVNRHTLRRAIEQLRQQGLVRVDRGRGMFVAAAPVTLSIGKRSPPICEFSTNAIALMESDRPSSVQSSTNTYSPKGIQERRWHSISKRSLPKGKSAYLVTVRH